MLNRENFINSLVKSGGVPHLVAYWFANCIEATESLEAKVRELEAKLEEKKHD